MKKKSLIMLTGMVAGALYANGEVTKSSEGPKATAAPRHFTIFSGKLLSMVDGIPGFMDATSFDKCYGVWQMLHKLQHKAEKFELDGKKVALKDLVLFERQLQTDNVPASDSRWAAFNKTLFAMKDALSVFTEPLLIQASSSIVKATNQKLMAEWIKDQKLEHTLLTKWGEPDQKETLYKTSALDFNKFCNDLKHFLFDIMYNCPKARQQFKELCIKKEHWEQFDKAFAPQN